MKTKTATAVAAALLLLVSAVGGVAAVSPSNSLPADFDSSTTTTDTVVVAIGSPDSEAGRASLVAANAIAQENNFTVVRVPDGTLPPSVVQTLSQRVQHDDLRNAIVVGVGQNNTDAVAAALTAVGHDGTTLAVEDQITGESASDLLYRASLQSWDSASSAYVTSLTTPDPAKVSLALANGTSGPVLAQSMGYTDLNATLQHLGVSTVYVTPGVSQSVRDDLTDDGFTVDASPNGITLDQSLAKVSVGYTGDTTEDVVLVGEQDHIYTASQVGSGANSSVLVTNGSSLGTEVETQLGDLTAVDDVYVLGSSEDVAESVVTDASSAVRANASVSRIDRMHGYTEMYLRTSLLASGYQYGVLASTVEKTEDNVTVDVTNIGYSTVLEVDNTSVTASWEGDIDSSSPTGTSDDGQWVVTREESMDPGDTFEVTLEASSLENAGHPESLDYYVGSSGALLGASGGLGGFFANLADLPGWLQDLVNSILPDLPFEPTSTAGMIAILVAVVLIGAALVFAFKSGVNRRR